MGDDSQRRVVLQTFRPNRDVLVPRVNQMVGHRFQAARSVHLQRVRSSEDPGREDEIGVAHRVIGMKVRDKRDLQILRPDCRDAFRRRRGGAAHDPRSEIDEICAVVDDNRRSRPRPFRVSSWGTSSEQDNFHSALWIFRDALAQRMPIECSQEREGDRNPFHG